MSATPADIYVKLMRLQQLYSGRDLCDILDEVCDRKWCRDRLQELRAQEEHTIQNMAEMQQLEQYFRDWVFCDHTTPQAGRGTVAGGQDSSHSR